MISEVVITDGLSIAAIQIETDGWDGYQGKWRQLKPFSKLIVPSAGEFRWTEAARWQGDGTRWRGVFYYTDESTPAFVLYTGSVPGFQAEQRGKGRRFSGSILVDTSKNKTLEDLWLSDRNLAWATRTVQPDWDALWIGPAFKVGGMAAFAGYEVATGALFNAGKAGATCFGAASTRFGFGVGASGGFAVCLATGYRTAPSLVGGSFGGLDLGLAIGEQWGSWLKGLKYAPQIGKFMSESRNFAGGAKALNTFIQGVGREDWVNLSKLLVSCVNSMDFSSQSISFFDIPPAGGGLELSFYNSTGSVKIVSSQLPDMTRVGPPPTAVSMAQRSHALYSTKFR